MKDLIKIPLMIAGGVIFMLSMLLLLGILFQSGSPSSAEAGLSNTKIFYFFLMWFMFTIALSAYLEQKLGDEPVLIWITSVIMAATFPVLWLGFNNVLTSNILGILFLVSAFLVLPKMSLKIAIMIGVGMVIYDWIAVFETDLMMNVASVAVREYIPLLLYIPDPANVWGRPIFALGLGDIVIPGLIIKAEMERAKEYDLPRVWNIPLFTTVSIVGYFIGLGIATIAVFTFKAAQPALIYIIPTMLTMLLLAYAVTGQFKSKEITEGE